MRSSLLLLFLSALFHSVIAIPQTLQHILYHDDGPATVHMKNAEHEHKTSPGDGAAVSMEQTPESDPADEDENENIPIYAPFSQMIARCRPNSHWKCHYHGKLICGCFHYKIPRTDSKHGSDEDGDGGFEDDIFKGYNVTQGDFLGHIEPGNAETLVPLFSIMCPELYPFVCRYVPGYWVDGPYYPGRWVCGCSRLPTINFEAPSSAPRHRCGEKSNEGGAQLPFLDKEDELIKERVSNHNLSSDFVFESLQFGFCKGIDVAFGCCPVCVDGIVYKQCRCRVLPSPCPKIKCCSRG